MKFSEGGSPRTCSWQLWSSPQGESRVFAPLSFHSLHQDVFISGSCMLRSVQRMGQNPSLLKNLLNELRVEDLYLPGLQRGEKKKKKEKEDVIQWILRAVTSPAASHQSREKHFRPQDIAGHCWARRGTLAALLPRTQKRKDPSF